MKIYYFSILIVFTQLISCTSKRYQVSTVSSDDVNEYFEYENEDLRLSYNFWQLGGILEFEIENLSEDPIFIDWEHSNFIFNGYSYDYFNDDQEIMSLGVYEGRSISSLVDLSTNINRVSPGNAGVSSGASASRSTVRREKESIQIPPRSYVNSKKIRLSFPWIRLKENSIQLSKRRSPLNIRTYIAYSTDRDLENVEYIDNDFWVSKTEKVKSSKLKSHQSFDKFYNGRLKVSFIKTLLAFGIPILLLLVLI